MIADDFQNFFFNAIDRLANPGGRTTGDSDQTLQKILQVAKDDTFNALCDSFNTPAAMAIISDLVSNYNSTDRMIIGSDMTHAIALWITSIVNIFGLNRPASLGDGKIGWSGIDIPEVAKPYLESLSRLRDNLRRKARTANGLSMRDIGKLGDGANNFYEDPNLSAIPYKDVLQNFRCETGSLKDSPTLSKEILQLCDRVRDVDLWELGVYLEDRDGDQPALIRPITNELRASRMEKEEREKQKQRAREQREREATARAEKGRKSHLEMFRIDEYSAWDTEGLPIKDKEGNEIAKSKAKKLRKEWEKQRDRHDAWTKASGA